MLYIISKMSVQLQDNVFQNLLVIEWMTQRKALCRPKSGNGPKLETHPPFHFWESPKLETAAVSAFELDPNLETQLPDPKVETSLTV